MHFTHSIPRWRCVPWDSIPTSSEWRSCTHSSGHKFMGQSFVSGCQCTELCGRPAASAPVLLHLAALLLIAGGTLTPARLAGEAGMFNVCSLITASGNLNTLWNFIGTSIGSRWVAWESFVVISLAVCSNTHVKETRLLLYTCLWTYDIVACFIVHILLHSINV